MNDKECVPRHAMAPTPSECKGRVKYYDLDIPIK